jgi:hypothetical protein
MATQVAILRAVRDLVPHLARLKNATMAFFNGLLKRLPVGCNVPAPSTQSCGGSVPPWLRPVGIRGDCAVPLPAQTLSLWALRLCRLRGPSGPTQLPNRAHASATRRRTGRPVVP